MHILGIETSCDDTAAAIIEAKGGFKKPFFSVLSNLSYSQVATHRKFGGVVPNLASRDHLKKIIPTIKAAISTAKIKQKNLDLVSVTRGPGLAPSLLIGINTARALAYVWKKSVIGVNHIEGHIYSNLLTNKKFNFPALILIVSGGHTELILMKNYGKYKIIGQTRDDAAGEAFDKTARLLGLKYPGGPEIARLAEKGNPEKFTLPKPMIDSRDYDFSFSGLKTAVLYEFQKNKKEILKNLPDFAAAIQNSIVDVLLSKTARAAKNYKPKTMIIAGGVAANKSLREKMTQVARLLKINFLVPEMSYTTDNAAMIAAAGYFNYLVKKPLKNSWKKMEMNANLRL